MYLLFFSCRLRSVLRPFLLCALTRNPCFLFLLIREGWKVRFKNNIASPKILFRDTDAWIGFVNHESLLAGGLGKATLIVGLLNCLLIMMEGNLLSIAIFLCILMNGRSSWVFLLYSINTACKKSPHNKKRKHQKNQQQQHAHQKKWAHYIRCGYWRRVFIEPFVFTDCITLDHSSSTTVLTLFTFKWCRDWAVFFKWIQITLALVKVGLHLMVQEKQGGQV